MGKQGDSHCTHPYDEHRVKWMCCKCQRVAERRSLEWTQPCVKPPAAATKQESE